MDRKLVYNGKEINQMSKEELENQLKINKERIKMRNLFFLSIILILILIYPLIAIFPFIICLITTYWLLQNNDEIEKEINQKR